jgi:hypothetical protein
MVRQQNKDKYLVIIPRLNAWVGWILSTCIFVIQSEEPDNLDAARVVSADEALKNLKEGNGWKKDNIRSPSFWKAATHVCHPNLFLIRGWGICL